MARNNIFILMHDSWCLNFLSGTTSAFGGAHPRNHYIHFSPVAMPAPQPLTTKQRAYLRSLAHDLKPVVHVGKEGVTTPVVRDVENTFRTRELLKVKVLDTAPESARETGEALAARIEGAILVQVIGRVVVLYHPYPKNPVIKLPG
jgi:RNA-binding protein